MEYAVARDRPNHCECISSQKLIALVLRGARNAVCSGLHRFARQAEPSIGNQWLEIGLCRLKLSYPFDMTQIAEA